MSDVRKERTFKIAYFCMFCGAEMYHDLDLQPSTAYAQCWRCWSKEIIENRDKFRQQADRWRIAAGVAWFIAIALGARLWV